MNNDADCLASANAIEGVELLSSDSIVADKEKEPDKSESDFILVKSRRSRKSERKVGDISLLHEVKEPLEAILSRPVTEKRQHVLKKILHYKDQLRGSPFHEKFLETILKGFEEIRGFSGCPELLHILCLGLGPISSHLQTRIPRYQLALLLLIKDEFGASVEVYDPVFIQEEKSILVEEFEFEVTEINEEGRRRIETPTLVFMPHCPHQLVNNFLYANWNPESLAKSFIICNSISEAVQTILPKYVEQNLSFIKKAHSICSELPILNTFKDQPDVFNDFSLHFFPPANFNDLSEDFWLDISDPVYSKPDFISNVKP